MILLLFVSNFFPVTEVSGQFHISHQSLFSRMPKNVINYHTTIIWFQSHFWKFPKISHPMLDNWPPFRNRQGMSLTQLITYLQQINFSSFFEIDYHNNHKKGICWYTNEVYIDGGKVNNFSQNYSPSTIYYNTEVNEPTLPLV